MSAFRNIRVYPSHGSRSAVITWEIAEGFLAGDVFVAASPTGTVDSWTVLNDAEPVPSAIGTFQDPSLVVQGGAAQQFYRLLLQNSDGDFMSEPIAIAGDIFAREYGIARGIMWREFTMMRSVTGYPVWHCIPRQTGTPAANVDPDTNEITGVECPGDENQSYGLPFLGGFYEPILTWITPLALQQGTIKDTPSEISPHEINTTTIRMLAFPRPSRGHMIVDPATDRRYLLDDEIKPILLRGVVPVAYDASMTFLRQSDPRYRFPVPALDTKNYRRVPYWT